MLSVSGKERSIRDLFPSASQNVALALVYFIAARIGLELAIQAEQVTLVWPPTGIALAAMLLVGRRLWPGIFVGALLANLSTNTPFLQASSIAAGNTLEALLGAALLKRAGFSTALTRTRDAVALVLAAALSTSVSASVGVLTLVGSGLQSWDRFAALWRDWWLGDAVGALTIVPVLCTWLEAGPPVERRSRVEAGGLIAALLAVWVIAFAMPMAAAANSYPLHYLVFPIVVWAVLRFGPRASSLLVLSTAAAAVVTTAIGRGPFAGRNEEALLLLQLFTAVVAVTSLILSTAIAERNTAYEALSEQHRRKDQFLATLSHELRNPLAPIVTAVEAIGELPGSAEIERLRQVLDRQVRHLVRLVDDLLDVSRIRTGKVRLRKQVIELGQAVRCAVEMSAPQLKEQAMALSVELPAEGIELEADPNRLAQVLSNLLSNAVRHGRAGGRIWLSVRAAEPDVLISVRDDGRGMSQAVLEQAFELFAQGPESGADAGLGVGLALVRQLVELHDGTVCAKSEGPGRGSEFVVRLPMLRRRPEPVPAPAPPVAAPAPAVTAPGPAVAAPAAAVTEDSHGRNVMVVDDNVDAAEMLATMLEIRGHHVSIAHDGSDALEHARSSVPDVMLLDIQMPKMSGYDVARAVRNDPRLHTVRLIAISGYGQEGDRARSKQAGFDVHMVKPVDVNALYAALEGGG